MQFCKRKVEVFLLLFGVHAFPPPMVNSAYLTGNTPQLPGPSLLVIGVPVVRQPALCVCGGGGVHPCASPICVASVVRTRVHSACCVLAGQSTHAPILSVLFPNGALILSDLSAACDTDSSFGFWSTSFLCLLAVSCPLLLRHLCWVFLVSLT